MILRIGIFIALTLGLRSTLVHPFHFLPFGVAYVTMAFFGFGVGAWRLRAPSTKDIGAEVLCFALVGVVFLWGQVPTLSTDVYRYRWDAIALMHGFNPLRFSPQEVVRMNPDLAFALPIDHRGLSSLYPPLAMALFWSVFSWTQALVAFTGFMGAIHIASTALLLRILRRLHRSEAWAFFFAAHPMLLLESAHSGHVDSAGIFFCLLALDQSISRKPYRAAAFALCAAWIKLWPFALVPVFAPREKIKTGIGATLFAALATLLIFFDPIDRTSSLWTYIASWEFHGALFWGLSQGMSGSLARMILMTAWVLSTLWIYRLYFRSAPTVMIAGLLVAAYLICSPTVYPWYVAWLVPWAILQRSISGMVFTLLSVVSYHVVEPYQEAGTWHENPAWFWVSYGAPLAILIFERLMKNGNPKARPVIQSMGLETQNSDMKNFKRQIQK